ncbi:unnamed protein product [Ceratitis capitata]|uniref:(Mediterranean fruit fly) hypothetical protein n=1 Tax=Ceratitis capitata TaxID=7213 RepID=A0A811U925_CERCA|nr:unnamed protein product [Ceratitis capitata]
MFSKHSSCNGCDCSVSGRKGIGIAAETSWCHSPAPFRDYEGCERDGNNRLYCVRVS